MADWKMTDCWRNADDEVKDNPKYLGGAKVARSSSITAASMVGTV